MSELPTLVLVVEDETQMLRFLRTALSAQDYRVVEAETGKAALVAATTYNPEIILLDLGLPDGDGIDLVRQIREWSRVPVVVISAHGKEDDKVKALDAGADDYLTKPFGVNELLAKNAGMVLTHRQILKEVWGPPYVNETHYLRVFMAQLRRKIEADPARPRLLVTEPGVGYRMKDVSG